MKTILVVDDEPRTREGIRRTLEAWSSGRYGIELADSGAAALERLEEHPVNLLITDIRMPEIGGLELIERLQEMKHPPVTIIISGYPEFDYARKALRYGVADYLLKPLDKTKLIQAVELALKKEEDQHRIERMEKLVDSKLLETTGQQPVYSEQVREALRYLDEHLDEPIVLKQLADHLHMNASYLSVLFKEQTGLTFSEYAARRKIQRAKEPLAGTTLTVADIAEQVGYQTSKYFVKVFRTHENISPGQYRQKVKDDQGEKIV